MPHCPIFCINLASRPDRWAHMQSEAERCNVTLTRIEAVTAEEARTTEAMRSIAPGLLGRKLIAPEVACGLSHRAAWAQFVETGQPCGIILEDDAQLAPGFATLAQTDWLPRDADLVRLEANDVQVKLTHVQDLKGQDRRIGRLKRSQAGTAGYVITRAAAQRLLADPAPMSEPIDVYLFFRVSPWFKALRLYQLVPAPVRQGAFDAGVSTDTWAGSSIYVLEGRRYVPSIEDMPARPKGDKPRPVRRLRRAGQWLAGYRTLEMRFG